MNERNGPIAAAFQAASGAASCRTNPVKGLRFSFETPVARTPPHWQARSLAITHICREHFCGTLIQALLRVLLCERRCKTPEGWPVYSMRRATPLFFLFFGGATKAYSRCSSTADCFPTAMFVPGSRRQKTKRKVGRLAPQAINRPALRGLSRLAIRGTHPARSEMWVRTRAGSLPYATAAIPNRD
jgi:hypothetical protein